LRYEVDFGKGFCKDLEQHGWRLLRVNGSHHVYGKIGEEARISVPIHGNKPLKIGLLKHFMKVAKLLEDDL
jgi:predicted RNA binding protein YcfA (HicA-like mRNA interferase family)